MPRRTLKSEKRKDTDEVDDLFGVQLQAEEKLRKKHGGRAAEFFTSEGCHGAVQVTRDPIAHTL